MPPYDFENRTPLPFDYLLALARHPRQVAGRPHDWLPWTYRTTLAADTS